jgi:formylglycine-generating enzyme required for sulfatase activity
MKSEAWFLFFIINLFLFSCSKSDSSLIDTKDTRTPENSSESSFHIGSTMAGKDGMILLYVPAGEFVMGSYEGADDEKPVYIINLDAFWIDQTEVTNEQYAKCVKDGWCSDEIYEKENYYFGEPVSDYVYYFSSSYKKYPVLTTWQSANLYCAWAGRRLLTEAEWEKAASWDDVNKQKLVYPWGNNDFLLLVMIDYVNFSGSSDGYGGIAPVGSYPKGASPYGVLDMAGNVREFVSSIYRTYPYSAEDGRENPVPRKGNRVTRGGDWYTDFDNFTNTRRGEIDPIFDYGGIRCAVSDNPSLVSP